MTALLAPLEVLGRHFTDFRAPGRNYSLASMTHAARGVQASDSFPSFRSLEHQCSVKVRLEELPERCVSNG